MEYSVNLSTTPTSPKKRSDIQPSHGDRRGGEGNGGRGGNGLSELKGVTVHGTVHGHSHQPLFCPYFGSLSALCRLSVGAFLSPLPLSRSRGRELMRGRGPPGVSLYSQFRHAFSLVSLSLSLSLSLLFFLLLSLSLSPPPLDRSLARDFHLYMQPVSFATSFHFRAS